MTATSLERYSSLNAFAFRPLVTHLVPALLGVTVKTAGLLTMGALHHVHSLPAVPNSTARDQRRSDAHESAEWHDGPGVQYCTEPTHALTYAEVMQLKYKKLIAITLWLVTIAVLGLSANLTSPASRMVVVALGVVPAFLVLVFWNGPEKTMSERIQEGRQ